MPAPVEIPIPGGGNADFGGAQGFTQSLGRDLLAPGRAEAPRTQQVEQLRSLIVAAGTAAVGAVSSEARLAAIAKQRSEERRRESRELANWVKARKAAEDNERQAAYRRANEERLQSVQRAQFQILRDPRSENHEWVLNEAVMRQGNAQFPEEQDAWNDFILKAQGAARQDVKASAAVASKVANAKIVSDRRIASKTAKNAIDDLWNDVQLDADLKDKLIGGGRGINDRVNEHVLEVAMAAAPQLFNLNEDDPFYAAKLEQQTILLDELENRAQQTIVDPLTNQYISNTQKSMEEAGADRIDIAAQSFAEGQMTAAEYHDLVGDTLRTQFAHVDPRQLDGIRERLYRQQFDRLAKLLDQPDPGKALERMESLISLADLNANEKQIIREQVIGDKFPKAVQDRLKQMYENKAAAMSGITRLNDGKTIVPRDPRVIEVEMLENGTYRDIANQMLDELGIVGDPANLTPLQSNLLGVIVGTMTQAEERAMQAQGKAIKSVERATRFLGGAALTSEEANDQWQEGALMRMFTGQLSPDDPVFQAVANAYKAKMGKDFPWDGKGAVPLNEDTLPFLRDVALQEGRAWAQNSLVQIPRSLSNTIENMALYESPERAEIALNFWQGLGSEGQERVGKDLSARAQMVMMEGMRLYNLDPVNRGVGMAEIASRVRTIDQNTAVAALRLAKDQAGLGEVTPDPRYHYDYAKALSNALGRDILKDEYGLQVEGFDIDVPGAGFGDSLGQGAVQGLSQTFGSNSALVPLYAQMAVVQQGNPGISLDEAAVVVAARMREQGWKIIGGTLGKQMVEDRWGHYPTDVTPSAILQQQLAQPMSKTQADRFIGRMPGVGPKTKAMTRDGVLPGEVLWSYMAERAEQAGSTEPIPHPREWAFLPETNGQLFKGMMVQKDGGVPMHVTIPGFGRTQMLVDTSGNPLLVVSSNRRATSPRPVDRSGIPDFFLTPHARNRFQVKPDSAGRMAEMMATIPEEPDLSGLPASSRQDY